ncbi:uncharacterized protein Z518_04196 [Rhinocladiella mackenziei CBS 650.93]|uniref:Sec39 domain-containing protein n=1 Tax=Rhinocladiella mackenziei CBS 650.93 TaxID=1442369 RepID=A0A0D2ISR7_9EURO|nr:uncharacterized protein Z518_04196 [Rhinocladiella mackenziei CBS 650.93]KIX06221.1 hypothetical protein Z518_04196 [Rhinocladiella mackenziei CBS 650.93]
MTSLTELTDAHAVLLAVQLASDGDLDGLHRVVCWRRHVLSNILVFRILLSFSPVEFSKQSILVNFLKALEDTSLDSAGLEDTEIDLSICHMSRNDALRRCQALKLRPIPEHTAIDNGSELANFIIEWAKRLELLSGAAQPLLEFVEPFVRHDPHLRLWYEAYLVPVVRLQYEFYPDNEDVLGVQDLEMLPGREGIKQLLQYAERQHNSNLARDLDYVVRPWVRGAIGTKRRKIDQEDGDVATEEALWEPVNDWFVSSSRTDFNVVAKAFVQWDGPVENPQPHNRAVARFAQTGLAMIYGCSQTTPETMSVSREMLTKAAGLGGLRPRDLSKPQPDIVLPEFLGKEEDEADLLPSSLSRTENRFTQVNESSVQLLVGLLGTSEILLDLGLPLTMAELARVCVFGSERRHKDELRRLLQHIPRLTRRDIDWRFVRRQLLWLRSWTNQQQACSRHQRPAFLCKLSPVYMETQVLDTLLSASQYDTVKEVYIDTPHPPLPATEVESRVVAAIWEAYDNASNGSKDRGGMKRANEILRAFRPNFPESSSLTDIDHLIRATHSLSFYQLTLQHGVPFKPVVIRVQRDPLSLVGKVLEQDAKAYTKLDDLLEIGRNLVRAHLPNRGNYAEESDPIELRVFNAEHRITYLAIMAALAANDFDTAYAYVSTRLPRSSAEGAASGFVDDTSWRAAYAAGKHRPVGSPKNLSARIDSLTQRMELLSRALMLAPSGDALSGILATWRRYEEEMDGLKVQAVEEERAFDAKADASLPGAFGLEDRAADAAETNRVMARRTGPGAGPGPSYEEQAPLGLFEVAKGAATAFRKSAAFPLGSGGLQNLKIQDGSYRTKGNLGQEAVSPDASEGGRARKRDMVTNMVTSGLVSGMGWVLGAQPRDRVDQRDRREPE